MFFIFFLRGHGNESCNVIGSVFSYLCPRATVTLSWIAEYIPNFVAIFHKYISFSLLGSILSKQVGRYLKPINNLWILSLLPLKPLWLTEKYWFLN